MKRRTYTPTAAQKAAAREKRNALVARSVPIQIARKSGRLPWSELPTVNACLELIYRQESGQTEFRTFQGWKADGFSVEKGAQGFAIWGKPLNASVDGSDAALDPAATPDDAEAAHGFSFFPLCYLFSAAQVRDKAGNRPPSFKGGESAWPFRTAEEMAARSIIAAPLAIAEAEEIDANEESPLPLPMAEPDETNPDTLQPHPIDGHACAGCYSTAHDGLDEHGFCADCLSGKFQVPASETLELFA